MAADSCETTIQVAALCGSIRPGSYTRMALDVALRGAADAGAGTDLIDLREYKLSFAGGDERSADVSRLCERVHRAHGLILGTPEYHGSLSGVLKNALDLMGFEEFEGKMVGLVGVSGGRMGGMDALNVLRNVGRALHAWVIPEQASIPEVWRAFENDGTITDHEHEERLKSVGRQVALFARLLQCAAAQDFLKTWEKAPINPGAE